MTEEEIAALASEIAARLPGYLLYRDPPQVSVGAPELETGSDSFEITAIEAEPVIPSE